MFGLSWGQIGIILIVGAFVLGPERIPHAVGFVSGALRKARDMADGAHAGLRREVGPELDELRRQIAELQSLTGMPELRRLRELHPQHLITTVLAGGEQASAPAGAAAGVPDPPRADRSSGPGEPAGVGADTEQLTDRGDAPHRRHAAAEDGDQPRAA